MIVNIRLDIPNAKVVKLAENETGKGWMTRKEIREWVEEKINVAAREGKKAEPEPSEETEEAPCEEATAIRDRGVRDFVPSRGDEPYLYKPQDPELAAACSTVLDGLEFIEQFAWATLERNRQ